MYNLMLINSLQIIKNNIVYIDFSLLIFCTML